MCPTVNAVPVPVDGHADPQPTATITPRYVIVPTQIPHLRELAVTMREADRKEIERLGVTVKKVLWRQYRNSIFTRTALVDAKVAAIWGLAIAMQPNVSPLSDLGIPWLHTSAAIEAIPRSFLMRGRQEVATMRRLRPRLASYVDASYAQAVRFIKLLGFMVDEPQPIGVDGAPFRRFHIGFDA
jgi:hypothetical protein